MLKFNFLLMPLLLAIALFFSSYKTLQAQDQNLDMELRESPPLGPKAVEELYNTIELAILGDYKRARQNFNALDTIFKEFDPEGFKLELLKWRAYMNKIERRYNESLTDYLAMLHYYETENNIEGLAEVHTHLAEFYRARNLKDKAFEHLEIAEGLFTNNEVSDCIIAYWHSRRAACESQFRSDGFQVKMYAIKGLEYDKVNCVYGTRGMILNELGFQFGHEDFDNESKITDYFRKAIEAFEMDNRQRDIITVKNNLSNYYYRRNKLDEALMLINEAIATGEQYNWLSALEDSYFHKMAILDALGEHEEAYRTSVTAYNAKIELMNYQYSVEVEAIEAEYEKELTEQALDEAREDAQLNQEAFILSLIFGGVLLIFTIVLVALMIKIRRNNASLKSQQRIIKRTNKQLSQAVGEKELLYKELNHRVKNNLMILSGLVYMQEQTEEEEKNKKLYELLRMRIHSIALVHEKLYGMDETSEIDFQEYLKELITLNFATLKGGAEIPSTITCQNLKVPIDQAIPLALIFNELINNVKKHAIPHTGTKIEVKAELHEDQITVKFRDNGPGLPPDFDWTTSTSMGMKIIHLMSQQLKAKAQFIPNQTGLVFELKLKRKGAQMSA